MKASRDHLDVLFDALDNNTTITLKLVKGRGWNVLPDLQAELHRDFLRTIPAEKRDEIEARFPIDGFSNDGDQAIVVHGVAIIRSNPLTEMHRMVLVREETDRVFGWANYLDGLVDSGRLTADVAKLVRDFDNS